MGTVPLSALRELSCLLSIRHPNILSAHGMLVSPGGQAFMRMELCPCDLRSAVEGRRDVLTQGEVKRVMADLADALGHVHARGFMHRDVKTSNVLVGEDGGVRLCDFGCAKRFQSRPDQRSHTVPIVTLWYRPPELLLGERSYGPEVDVWSLGCVFGELLNLENMWEGRGEVDQLARIFKVLGRPTEKVRGEGEGGAWELKCPKEAFGLVGSLHRF